MNYAVVDIETTGGYASKGAITEIAIIITNGQLVLNRYSTLINPEQEIPYYITRLTGINNAMVASAPTFNEVAATIFNTLNGCIFVAHNVGFDYSFVNYQLKQCGYTLTCKKLCTVRFSKKIFIGLPSYSLGNLCKSLDIPLYDRHRATGDAEATCLLLHKTIQADEHNELDKLLKNKAKERNLPLQVTADNYDELPTGIGVYYFWNSKQKIIYIGKAINIKKRIASHFVGNKTTNQRQEFIRNIAYITYTLCATELMSLVLESTEIKHHWPKYNQAQKQYEQTYALYHYPNQQGYYTLVVDKKKKNLPYLITVKNKIDGLVQLRKLVENYGLCPKYCQVAYMASEDTTCTCGGACTNVVSSQSYNQLVLQAIASVQNKTASYALIGQGLQATNKSVLVVQQGNCVGLGYIPSTLQFSTYDALLPHLQLVKPNNYINSLVLQAIDTHQYVQLS